MAAPMHRDTAREKLCEQQLHVLAPLSYDSACYWIQALANYHLQLGCRGQLTSARAEITS